MNRMNTVALIGLMILGAVGCSGSSSDSIVAPELGKRPVEMTSDSVDCLSVADMCDLIIADVESACPDDGFDNYGQLNSCRRHALDVNMKNLPDCYSGSERLTIKKRVMIAVGLANFLEGPTRPLDSRPIPHQQ